MAFLRICVTSWQEVGGVEEEEREEAVCSCAHLLPGTAKGLLPVRVALCSDWLEEEELEDLASADGWARCSSRGLSLFHTTICGDEVMPFLLHGRDNQQIIEFKCHFQINSH